eukprot:766394-Hanusia_phi.AAC.2
MTPVSNRDWPVPVATDSDRTRDPGPTIGSDAFSIQSLFFCTAPRRAAGRGAAGQGTRSEVWPAAPGRLRARRITVVVNEGMWNRLTFHRISHSRLFGAGAMTAWRMERSRPPPAACSSSDHTCLSPQ